MAHPMTGTGSDNLAFYHLCYSGTIHCLQAHWGI